jgi:hypothetical protein
LQHDQALARKVLTDVRIPLLFFSFPAEKIVRASAVVTVKKWALAPKDSAAAIAPGMEPVCEQIEAFARQSLETATLPHPPADASSMDLSEEDVKPPVWVEAEVTKYLDLFLAMCHKRPELLPE